MEWQDTGIVLGARRHGETAAVLDVFTAAHGRHMGLVRGGAGRRLQPVLQPGNRVALTWRARLEDQLGNFSVELLDAVAARHLGTPEALAAIGHLGHLLRLLPERDPHAALFATLDLILDHLDSFEMTAPLLVRFELALLAELGFGLDLAECAATGATQDLIHVSPKSGRAVSREAGLPYAGRLLALPGFLRTGEGNAIPLTAEALWGEVEQGFALTGFFLARHVFEPRGLAAGEARLQLLSAVARRQKRHP